MSAAEGEDVEKKYYGDHDQWASDTCPGVQLS